MSNIELTDKAFYQLRKLMVDDKESILQEDSKIESVLRIGVNGGGCSGLSYRLEFVSENDINFFSDMTFKESRMDAPFVIMKIVIDQKSLKFLEGTTLDFQDGLHGKGFVFNNPKATGTCGCGESFSI